MDLVEEAKIRIDHWIKHNENHVQEYEAFAQKLESADKDESARNIRVMMELISQSNESLKRALEAL